MLQKEKQRLRLTLLIGSGLALLLLYVSAAGSAVTETLVDWRPIWIGSSSSQRSSSSQTTLDGSVIRPFGSGSRLIGSYGEITGFAPPTTLRPGFVHPLHTEIFSVTTADRRYFRINFGGIEALNPSIIPHPEADDTWIVVAQPRGLQEPGVPQPSVVLACKAKFIDEQLTCVGDDGVTPAEPLALPVAPTASKQTKCTGDLAVLANNAGPQDARVFYGPDAPYLIYGSSSAYTCMGQWLVDLRVLIPDANWAAISDEKHRPATPALSYPAGTELQRPKPYSPIEQDWFLFWDASNHPHTHLNIVPTRSLARVHPSGRTGRDLARRTARHDDACLARYLPRVLAPELESVRQATNSLAVTLCRRSDPSCVPDDDNTFVLSVFHHRTQIGQHASYHPYLMLFRRRAPFELWAVGARPVWISGRGSLADGDTEMVRVSGISWRARGMRYHGFADDVIFLSFGIEERMMGGIDVFAGDLLANLGLCRGDEHGVEIRGGI